MNKRILAILLGLLLIGLLIGLSLAVKTISAKGLEINSLKDDLSKKNLKLTQLEQQIKELNLTKNELEERKNDLGMKLARLEAEFGGVRENEANLKKQVGVLLEEKNNAQVALTQVKQSAEAQLQLSAKENKQALESVAKQYLAQEKDLLRQMSGIKQKFKKLNNEKDALKQDLLEVNAKLELKQSKFNHYKLGINYEFDKKYLEAVGEYKKIIEIDPQEAYANFRLASIYIRDIKDKERADFYSIRFEELKNLENADRDESAAGLLESAEKKKIVNVALDKSIQGSSSVTPPKDAQSEKSDRPLETFEDRYFKRRYNLALLYEDTQRYEDAVKEYEKALELAPFNADICYNLGILYDDCIKDRKKAVFYYQKYLELAPSAEDARQVKSWILKANDELNWQKRLR